MPLASLSGKCFSPMGSLVIPSAVQTNKLPLCSSIPKESSSGRFIAVFFLVNPINFIIIIRGKQGCYKLKFYGIMSSQCLQMTTSLSCANQCVFCWRDYKAPVSKEWKWRIDDPELILTESLKMHHQLMKLLVYSIEKEFQTF